MSTVYADTLEPTVPTKDTTLGASGDSITIGANSINTNVIQDSGGNVLFQSDGSGTLSNVNSAFAANLKLLSTQTASDSATISITSDIDSTYDLYIFKFISIAPATNDVQFQFQVNADGASGYNETITSTYFRAYNPEAGGGGQVDYIAGQDQAQGTSFQTISASIGSDADQDTSGELYLFSPSSTTYVKHFYARFSSAEHSDAAGDAYAAGYVNTTSAINQIQFKMSSGNFDGVIKMYGL